MLTEMTRYLRLAGLASALTVTCSLADAATLTRGPYLQVGTPSSVVVRWRTDAPCDSVVRYGTDLLALGSEASQTAEVTEHLVKVSGLAPSTKYFYTVGTSSQALSGQDSSHYFMTSPDPLLSPPVHMWVTGDFGYPGASQLAARDAFYSYNSAKHCDLWLWLGDDAYFVGEDWEYQSRLFDVYPTALARWVSWPCPGNHDLGLTSIPVDSRPYFLNFTVPTAGEAGGVPSGNIHYYSYEYGDVHFVSLDCVTENRTATGRMARWLAQDLQANTKLWTIVIWHYPPYSRGSYDSDVDTVMRQMREVFLPIVEAAGVDMVLAGHSHSYERSYLLDGHYGLSSTLAPYMIKDGGDGRETGNGAYHKPAYGSRAHHGTVYVLSGAGGRAGTNMPLNHPAMQTSLGVAGTMAVDITGNRLDARYITESGIVADSFTIIKDTSASVSSLGDARKQADGTPVSVSADVAVTLAPTTEPGVFYVESLDRAGGIRVESTSPAPPVGTRGAIAGTLATKPSGERVLTNSQFSVTGTATTAPFRMRLDTAGGKGYMNDPGQISSQGLLVRVTGRVLSTDTTAGALWLDDGSSIESGGIKVTHAGGSPEPGALVSVVGVISAESSGGSMIRVILGRDGAVPGDYVQH